MSCRLTVYEGDCVTVRNTKSRVLRPHKSGGFTPVHVSSLLYSSLGVSTTHHPDPSWSRTEVSVKRVPENNPSPHTRRGSKTVLRDDREFDRDLTDIRMSDLPWKPNGTL